MKVHHLNCGTMRAPFNEALVAHVLLIETDSHLVLVDAGFGSDDISDPTRIGPARHAIRPDLNSAETALSHVHALGYDAGDVRHIVATHLDIDHIGGASDFPQAKVHTTATEKNLAYAPSLRSALRYREAQLPAARSVIAHPPGTEWWHGFAGATALSDIADGIMLIPMPGHTLGHAAVAVDAGTHWVLHCGDAFFHRSTLIGETPPMPLRMTEKLFAMRPRAIPSIHRRIAALHTANTERPIQIVCSHDPQLLAVSQQVQHRSGNVDRPDRARP